LENFAMKRIVLLMTLAVMMMSTAGCNSCGRSRWSCWNWFNRGDSCNDCSSGVPGGAMYGPSMGPYSSGGPVGPEYLPGPASTQIIN
jgi:hypothetical protein